MKSEQAHVENEIAVQKSLRARQAGFTLVEVLIVIAIVSIVFGTIYSTFQTFNRSYTKENVKAGVQQNARMGVEFMIRDIRLAGLDPLGSAGAAIVAIGDSRIQFTADLNYDGDVEDDFENLTYELTGNRLMQTNHLGVAETLLDNVAELDFTYLNVDEVETSDPDEVRTVVISLTLQRPAGFDERVRRTYTTRVRCRNL